VSYLPTVYCVDMEFVHEVHKVRSILILIYTHPHTGWDGDCDWEWFGVEDLTRTRTRMYKTQITVVLVL
jgi:hypothetical protein